MELFINGAWAASTGTECMLICNPATGELLDTVPAGTAEDGQRAITLANDSVYGLAGYVFGQNLRSALEAAEALEVGSVWVNNIHRSSHSMPFGGYKESGIGREKSHYGLEEYLELKSIYLGG